MVRGSPSALPLLDAAAAERPGAVAVSGPDGTVTYAELNERAERVARRLQALGVQRGDLVGLCVERSAALVVGAVGIVKAAAAYVAIDPNYPDERIRWMLDDAGAVASVADATTHGRLEQRPDRPSLVLAGGGELDDGADPPRAADAPALPSFAGDDVAYVVYTSGSTGRPKGVVLRHDGLANLVAWHVDAFGLDADQRCTQIASPGFDASVWEIWPTLASGAALHVVPEDLRADPPRLRDWLLAEGITVSFLPTAVAEAIVALDWPADAPLRFLLTGGDALTRRPPPGLPFALINNYGLSETTVVATSGPVAPDGDAVPSIGRAIAGLVAEVVDDELEPVGPGAAGELLIGGVAVAAGYLGRPELTAERFVDTPRGRRYRTGDRVRRRDDGEIEFLGRSDDQLSIRSFRVEPGEVAAALNAHPAVAASVAIGVGSRSGDRRLVAYLSPTGAEQPRPEELAAFLRRTLPEHMVPSLFVWLEELPLTAHGKIDRDALPAPAELATGDDPQTARRAGTAVETEIAAMAAELLEVEAVGMDDNIFLLGGHSMLGAQLIARLADRFDVEVSLRYLFDHPTAAQLAAEVERQIDDAREGVAG